MPELPEVETTKNFLSQHIIDNKITAAKLYRKNLRWPISECIPDEIIGKKFISVDRRGKYLILNLNHGSIIMHLGMSGSIAVRSKEDNLIKHDHFDISFSNNTIMRYNDPRRFGAILWSYEPYMHSLISSIGPEPLSDDFSADFLYNRLQNSKANIKNSIMNSKIVSGVGNIYACEALFCAKINPIRKCNTIKKLEFSKLVKYIKEVLEKSIEAGGTSIKDFKVNEKTGYFQQKLQVYGRDNQSCNKCGDAIISCVIGQRSTFYCAGCQI